MSKHIEMIIDYVTDGTDYQYNGNHGLLIRCKNCKYFNDGDCTELPKICGENDFCSWGEKNDEQIPKSKSEYRRLQFR